MLVLHPWSIMVQLTAILATKHGAVHVMRLSVPPFSLLTTMVFCHSGTLPAEWASLPAYDLNISSNNLSGA